MEKQTIDNNAILAYWAAIESGDIVVCSKVRTIADHLAKKVRGGVDDFYFDPRRAEHIIRFFETYLRHSKGDLGGQKIKLELWQRAFFSALFGFVDEDELRQYRRGLLIVGKKNGKSLMASGCGLYGMMGDGEPGAEVYSVGTTRDQAKIIWEEARRMRNKAPALRKRVRATVGGLYYDEADSLFKPLASDVNTLDGLNVHYALMDEIQQWIRGRQLYDMIADGVAARSQPLVLLTTTAGTVREDLYDELYEEAESLLVQIARGAGIADRRTLPFIYELDRREEWKDPACWIKANPNLGVSKKLSTLEDKVARACDNSRLIKNLVCKEFNIRETSSETWLSFEEIKNPATFELTPEGLKLGDALLPRPKYGIGGFDLSITTDLTAAAVIFKVPGRDETFVLLMFWLPEELLDKRVKEDKVPYDIWLERGLLRTCPGNRIDHRMVKEWFIEVQEQMDIYLPWIGYDNYTAPYLVSEMKQVFGERALEPVIQGAKTLSGPLYALGADVKAHKINYNNNPILAWCMCNVGVVTDRNGNIVPIKSQGPTRRIDGFAALLNAIVELDRHREEYEIMIA